MELVVGEVVLDLVASGGVIGPPGEDGAERLDGLGVTIEVHLRQEA